jgi:predicted HTH transcriptional regulator
MPGIFNSLNSIEEIIKFIGTFSPDTDSQARENTNMEYKEVHRKFSNTNEIGKDVSAFANREGGLFFYGVKCDPSDPTKPQAITGLEVKNINTFDRVVNSHIHYPIKGLQKKIIPNHDPKVMLVCSSK